MDPLEYFRRLRLAPGGYTDVYWGTFTIVLSIGVAAGYLVIAFKWFFQFKLSQRAEAHSALARLRTIVAGCAVLTLVFFSLYLLHFRFIWRVYDSMLFLLLCYTWVFAFRLKGMVLMDERLGHMRELETEARQKSFFLNALSHDLRAPLNNISLNAHLLKMSPRDGDEAEAVNTIADNALTAGELLTNLLEYASAGHENNLLEEVCVTATLHQVRRRFLPLTMQRGLYLNVFAGDRDVICHTDRRKLERIISNLVDNAVKYTRLGGIELSTAEAANQRIALRVTDTGCGVPAQSAAHLFDEFFQVDNRERDRRKGFGLGLAICKSLARQLGGDVRLVRTGPDGSCFEVTFKDFSAGAEQQARHHTRVTQSPAAALNS